MSITTIENFYKETIAQDWPLGTGNFYVSTKPTVTTGWLVISPASSTLREIIKYTAVGTDGTGDYITVATRGIGGTTEQTHVIGEPIRMNVLAENMAEISTALDEIVAGGAQTATESVSGIAKLPRIETTAGTTHSLTTVAGEKVIVWAKGNVTNSGQMIITLKYNGVVKDTVILNPNSTPKGFSLMYTETPGANTYNITIDTEGTTCENPVIIVLKI